MEVVIRFFATLKDRAGQERLSVTLHDGATVGDLLASLSAEHPALAEALPTSIVAVNHEYAFDTDPLKDSDEVAFFPPVSGGADGDAPSHEPPEETPTADAPVEAATEAPEDDGFPEYFAITQDELDLNELVARITLPSTGAVATFTGKVRGATQVDEGTLETEFLEYEAYPEMAEAKLRQVAEEIRERWPDVEGIALVQRIGKLEVGTTTVVTACSAGHRDQGVFEAARYAIDRVKEIVPVWKKEVGPDGEAWVEGHYHPTPEDAPGRVAEVEALPAPPATPELSATVSAPEPEPAPILDMGLRYICPACHETYPLDTSRWRCECGEAFDLQNPLPFDGPQVMLDDYSMWRYRAMLLPGDIEPVTMGEGWTPLLPTQLDGWEVYLKLEGLNPSGSFKDRGTAVHLSLLRALGITTVHDDSSGNAGASLAAYAARAGMRARVFAPSSASPVKLAQMRLYGAELVTPEGPRSAAAKAALEAAENGSSHYASHVYSPLTALGMKTLAYEIWEQLGSRPPDAVVMPVGHGSQVLGMAAGFRDLLEAGVIERLPRLIGVQAAACAPLWSAFKGLTDGVEENPTLAEGIRIIEPVRAEAVLAAIRESEGRIVAVQETEIMDGMRELAKLGVLVEPTSAVVLPALKRVEDALRRDSVVVLSLTGSGFKAPALDDVAKEALAAQAEQPYPVTREDG